MLAEIQNFHQKFMSQGQIIFRTADLCIKTLESGDDVVQIDPRLAFNSAFVQEMRDAGVQKYIRREKKEE